MSRRLLLESFDTALSQPSGDLDALPEEKWLEAFEKGYRDGWEDAERALSRRQGQITDGFAQQLQDLTFTLSEARVAVRREMSVLLSGVLDTMLPGALADLIGPQILAELDDLAEKMAEVQIEVVVSSEQTQLVESFLTNSTHPSAIVRGDPARPKDTAVLRFGDNALEIDLNAALAEISDTLASYFDEPLPLESANG